MDGKVVCGFCGRGWFSRKFAEHGVMPKECIYCHRRPKK